VRRRVDVIIRIAAVIRIVIVEFTITHGSVIVKVDDNDIVVVLRRILMLQLI